ncbi:MAG: heavy metal-responsive transcriptional regulator [Chloroflexi bacterium]|nr:heavy metal-responsive transcriptional regulator [Chloroflexota bacterium]
MRIGELAGATGVSARTVRFYEKEGLLPPPRRSPSDYRDDAQGAVERLAFVAKAKRLGLSLEEVRQTFALRDQGQTPCVHVLALLDRKIVEIDRALDALRAFRQELARIRGESAQQKQESTTGATICCIIEQAVHLGGEEALVWLEANRARRGKRLPGPRLRGERPESATPGAELRRDATSRRGREITNRRGA